MAGNPVKYAEEVLGVHEPWEEGQRRLEALGKNRAEKVDVRKAIRQLQSKIADREADVVIEVQGASLGSETKTELDRRKKDAIRADPSLQDYRSELDDLRTTEDMLDSDIKHDEAGLAFLAARMTELGGLLSFYAAARIDRPQVQVKGPASS